MSKMNRKENKRMFDLNYPKNIQKKELEASKSFPALSTFTSVSNCVCRQYLPSFTFTFTKVSRDKGAHYR